MQDIRFVVLESNKKILRNLVKPKSTYVICSNNSTLLLPPTQKMLHTLGARSFAAAAPALWNKLPADVRTVASLNSFKKSIKTFLFNDSF